MIRVKICGITRIDDALAAAAAGANALGLVFVEQSRRNIDVGAARAIVRRLPPFINRVGLFMDPAPGQVEAVLKTVALDTLQFHGSESPEFCAGFDRPWIKALAMGSGSLPDWNLWAEAQALLLDSHGGGKLGGSGHTFDWALVPKLKQPWVLAGGLDPYNVTAACRQLRPAAVDVSSGVEKSPGIKDHRKMQEFIEAVRHA